METIIATIITLALLTSPILLLCWILFHKIGWNMVWAAYWFVCFLILFIASLAMLLATKG